MDVAAQKPIFFAREEVVDIIEKEDMEKEIMPCKGTMTVIKKIPPLTKRESIIYCKPPLTIHHSRLPTYTFLLSTLLLCHLPGIHQKSSTGQ